MSANQFLAPEAASGRGRTQAKPTSKPTSKASPKPTGGRTPAASGRGGPGATNARSTNARSTSARGTSARATGGGGSSSRSQAKPRTAAPAAARSTARTSPRTVGAAPRRKTPVMFLVVVALLVTAGVAGGWGLGRGADVVRGLWPAPAPALPADKVAPPTPAEVGGPSQPCPPSSLGLTLSTGVTSIDPGQYVTFEARVTNIGRRPCLVDAGNASRQVEILDASGAVVWTTAHCGGNAVDLLLGPGEARPDSVRWSGRSSVPGACDKGQGPVPPGQYTARIVMADDPDVASEPVHLTVVAPPPAPSPDGAPAPEEQVPDGVVTDEQKPDPPVTDDSAANPAPTPEGPLD